jgi:lipopolysaccharide exporter
MRMLTAPGLPAVSLLLCSFSYGDAVVQGRANMTRTRFRWSVQVPLGGLDNLRFSSEACTVNAMPSRPSTAAPGLQLTPPPANQRPAPPGLQLTPPPANQRPAPPANPLPSRRKPQSLSSNVRSGAMWSMSSTMLLRLAGITVTAIVARILSPHDFGVFAIAITVYTIVFAFGEFGVTSCLARADLDIDALAPTMWAVSLASSVLIAGVLVIFAEPIATNLGSADGAGPVRLMALVMILVGVAAVPTAQLVRDFKQDRIFLANILSFISSTTLLLVLAKSGSGAMAFAWSRVGGQLTSCLVIVAVVPRRYRIGMTRNALSVLLKFGVPLACANFVSYILQNVDYALIGRFMGAVMLGTYVLAFNVASWSSSLMAGVLNLVSMPAFSRVKDDPGKLKDAMADGVRAVVLIAGPMCTLLIVLARPLVLTMYGTRWERAAGPLSILSLYGLVSIVCLLFANMLAALGKSKFVLIVQLVWLAALIPAMAIGVHRNGILGAATAHIVIIGPLVLPCYLIALKRVTGIRSFTLLKAALPALTASVLAAFIAWSVTSFLSTPLAQLIAGASVGGLFYVVVTAPQTVRVIARGTRLPPRVRRILRSYNHAGQTIGIPAGPPPRHARIESSKPLSTSTRLTRV